MAHVWLREHEADTEGWEAVRLGGDGLALDPARILRHGVASGEAWVLVGPPAVRVNGHALGTGIHVLADRDEVRVAGRRMFFSTETLPQVVAFPGAERPVICPRCKQPIEAGRPAVRCPMCAVWHHQDPARELPCWTYTETCATGPHPTALDSGFRWTPEDL